VTRDYHDRKLGRVVRALICGDAKKHDGRLSAKTPDNVTVIAPKPADFLCAGSETHPYARAPWLDIAVDSAHVWGCAGRVVGRAERFKDVSSRVMPPILDLTVAAAR